MRHASPVKLVGAGILFLAAGGIAPVQGASPGVTDTQPSSTALSPPMSDLPVDHLR
jgi:hypothetical protein